MEKQCSAPLLLHSPSCSFTSTKSCENLTWLKHENQSVTPDWQFRKTGIQSRQRTAYVGNEMRLGARGSWWYQSWLWMHTVIWNTWHLSHLLHMKARLVLLQLNCLTLCVHRSVSGCDVMSVNVKLKWNNREIFFYKCVKKLFKEKLAEIVMVLLDRNNLNVFKKQEKFNAR